MRSFSALLIGASYAAGTDIDALSLLQGALASTEPAPYWSGKNGDVMRTGSSKFTVPSNLEAGPTWSFKEEKNGLVRASPVIDSERNIYISTINGKVHKFAPDGEEIWSFQASHSIPDGPALADGKIFVCTDAGLVIALSVETGKAVWKHPTGYRAALDTWSIAAAEGTVIVAGSTAGLLNRVLVAMDAENGGIKWEFKPSQPIYNVLPIIKDNSVFFQDQTGSPYRLELQTGELVWKAPPGPYKYMKKSTSTGAAVLGPNDVLYVTSNELLKGFHGRVAAFNVSDGKQLWRYNTIYEANVAPAVGKVNGKLAVVLGVGPNPDSALPQLAGIKPGPKSMREKRHRVLALNAKTGNLIWSHEMAPAYGYARGDTFLPMHNCLPDAFSNPAIGGDGTVYVGRMDGMFYAIRDQNSDGKIQDGEVSSYDVQAAFQGAPAIAPGMLVATPCNGLHVWLDKSA